MLNYARRPGGTLPGLSTTAAGLGAVVAGVAIDTARERSSRFLHAPPHPTPSTRGLGFLIK
jgi:multisubunit Na+/H+ antiporter MnhB subunit